MNLLQGHLTNEQKKDLLKNELLSLGYFKTPDGLQLYELNLQELEQIYQNEKRRSELCQQQN